MIIRQFILTKEAGLHAARLFVADLASKFCSTIYLEKKTPAITRKVLFRYSRRELPRRKV